MNSFRSISVGDVNDDGMCELVVLGASQFRVYGPLSTGLPLVKTQSHGVSAPQDLSIGSLDCFGADIAVAGHGD